MTSPCSTALPGSPQTRSRQAGARDYAKCRILIGAQSDRTARSGKCRAWADQQDDWFLDASEGGNFTLHARRRRLPSGAREVVLCFVLSVCSGRDVRQRRNGKGGRGRERICHTRKWRRGLPWFLLPGLTCVPLWREWRRKGGSSLVFGSGYSMAQSALNGTAGKDSQGHGCKWKVSLPLTGRHPAPGSRPRAAAQQWPVTSCLSSLATTLLKECTSPGRNSNFSLLLFWLWLGNLDTRCLFQLSSLLDIV
jgi:hypothetical protein